MMSSCRQAVAGVLILVAVLAGCQQSPPRASATQPFTGLRVNRRELIFMCDGSANMRAGWDDFRTELHKAVTSLRPPQTFDIILCRDAACETLSDELLDATATNKQRAMDFVGNYVPGGAGACDLRAGLAAASAELERTQREPAVVGDPLRPTVYVVLAGPCADAPGLARECRAFQARWQGRINTVAFLSHDADAVLKQIAADCGGTYRYVSSDDLYNFGRYERERAATTQRTAPASRPGG